MSLAFDPWKSPNYKVISLQISKLEPTNHQIEIYSSEHMKWRVSGQTFPRDYDIRFKNGLVYWNGAIYVSCIKRFNIEQEKFEEVDIPEVQDHEDDDYRIVYFGESYGHLHLIQVNRQNLALYNIYEMKHDGAGWFLKYEMNVEDVVLAFPHIIRDFLETTEFHYYGMAVLDVVRGDKEDDSFLILHITEMVILRYNLVDKSFYKLWVLTMVFMMHLLGVCILIDQTLTSTLNLPIVGKFTSTLQRYRCLLLQLGGILTACLDGR